MKISIKDTLLAVMCTSVLVACGGPHKKTETLLSAESAYQQAKADPEVLKYAGGQLDEAAKTLNRSAQAETADGMNTLAYVGNNQVLTALEIADLKRAEKELKELSKVSDRLALRTRENETQKAQLEAQRARDEAQMAKSDKEQLQQELAALQAEKTERGMVMTLGDVLFETGKAELMPGAVSTLNRLGQFMKQYPEKELQIEGHTDSVGSASFNLRLSEDRANSVRDALLSKGVSSNRMSTIGYGMGKPVATNATAVGRQSNRRVEIVIQ